MTSRSSSPTKTEQPNQRFLSPATPVDERIDQVAAYSTGKQHQAEWLKRILREHWKGNLPQPFVGFDEEQDAFVLVWQSDTECDTLYVDADNQTGTYCPWPNDASGEPLEELDLDTEKAWLLLQTALTGMNE